MKRWRFLWNFLCKSVGMKRQRWVRWWESKVVNVYCMTEIRVYKITSNTCELASFEEKVTPCHLMVNCEYCYHDMCLIVKCKRINKGVRGDHWQFTQLCRFNNGIIAGSSGSIVGISSWSILQELWKYTARNFGNDWIQWPILGSSQSLKGDFL